MSFLYFLVLVFVFFWWFSSSSTVSLLLLIIMSVAVVLEISLLLDFKLSLFLGVLVFGGGLFILVAFVILSYLEELEMGVMSLKRFPFFFTLLCFGFEVNFEGVNYEVEEVWGVINWGSFCFLYIFLVFVLFVFLFLVNSILDMGSGGMFSSKKEVGFK